MIVRQGVFCPVASDGRIRLLSRVRLAKVPLCLMLGLSTVFGFLLAFPGYSWRLGVVFFGVTLLAAGAASLNSLQEWRRDALLRRTGDRPLPRGELRPRQALWQALLLIVVGLLLLSLLPGPLPMGTGLLALLIYNGVYTPLKARTLLAIVPGALCGSLPPVIGWLAGGGRPESPVVLLIILLLVLWQVPHSWLVILMYPDDDRAGGMPGMLRYISEQGLRRLLVPWAAALAAAMLLFSLPPINPGGLFRVLLLLAPLLLLMVFVTQAFSTFFRNDRMLFICLNSVFFFHLLVICGARTGLLPAAGY